MSTKVNGTGWWHTKLTQTGVHSALTQCAQRDKHLSVFFVELDDLKNLDIYDLDKHKKPPERVTDFLYSFDFEWLNFQQNKQRRLKTFKKKRRTEWSVNQKQKVIKREHEEAVAYPVLPFSLPTKW